MNPVPDKSFPATTPTGLSGFSTPLLVLDDAALTSNVAAMAAWVADHGLELMPHGKTTMAPTLWRRQLAAGATGITLATAWQARVALDAGVPFVQVANACLDDASLVALRDELAARTGQDVVSWVDAEAAVAAMERILAAGPVPPARRFGVLVELGAPGGRTGARSIEAALRVAERVAASPLLELRGVAGYEGALAHDRTGESLRRVRVFLDDMVALLERLRPLLPSDPIITAGGSAYFDVVAEAFAGVEGARRVTRSGAYIAHDSGFYRGISPLDAGRHPGPHALRPAMWGFARVVSQPEPGLALLDGGKRDFPFDEGLPEPVAVADKLGGAERPLAGAVVTALNDQHTFLRWEGPAPVAVGEVVRLGLSHPCTAFDKWRRIPVLDHLGGRVVGAVETFF